MTRLRGEKLATNFVPGPSTAAILSSEWASSASSLASSVCTDGASMAKWTTISDPSASVSMALERIRWSSGTSLRGPGSLRSSERMPIATVLPT